MYIHTLYIHIYHINRDRCINMYITKYTFIPYFHTSLKFVHYIYCTYVSNNDLCRYRLLNFKERIDIRGFKISLIKVLFLLLFFSHRNNNNNERNFPVSPSPFIFL